MNLTIPNLLSIRRMGLIPWFASSVIDGDATQALWIFAVAGVTGALDGFMARFGSQQSALGAYRDPLAENPLAEIRVPVDFSGDGVADQHIRITISIDVPAR